MKATYIALGAIFYHSYIVFYTVLIYHDVLETFVGMFFGLLIFASVFLTDVFSDSLFSVLIRFFGEE